MVFTPITLLRHAEVIRQGFKIRKEKKKRMKKGLIISVLLLLSICTTSTFAVTVENADPAMDDDWTIRQETTPNLRLSKDPREVRALIDDLKDKAPEVRKRAAFALGHLREKTAVPALIKTLKDPDKDRRALVARTLGRIGDKSALPFLVAAS